LRVGVVGAGRIGSLHAGLLARRLEGAVLAAVADVRPEAAEALGASLGVPVMSTPQLVADGAIDVVAICASTDTHVELICAAAEAGKAVFCEKPLSLRLDEVDRALHAVASAGVTLMVGFNRRFDPAHRAVRDAVASGQIGEVHLVRITSRDPAPPPLAYAAVSGGIFLDMTIHDFDMARFVTGSEVVEVAAFGAVRIEPALAELGDLDTAAVVLTHENGCLSIIDNSRQAVYGYDQRVEAFGSGGVAASDNPLVHTTLLRNATATRQAVLPTFFLERYAESYRLEWEAFLTALSAGEPAPVGGADGRAPLVIGLAARRSVDEHRPVRTDEI
ncbi:MAG TPA: inositol 2-dehydrogenase, partial [Acidimicrobiales bacterium]|nr:inositol 2-dehydrogenase [Acidimicrobiales bacterium]